MELNSFEKDQVIVIEIKGRLDAEHAEMLKDEFKKHLQKQKHFVLNAAQMDYLDSTGLGAIVFCLKSCTEQGGSLKLANLTEKPRIIFEITRAYKIFDIFDSMEAAMTAM